MSLAKRQAAWDERVRTAFAARYKDSPRALGYYIHLWAAHLDAGFPDEEMVSALIGADECARRQRIWEMQLGAHLRVCGHRPTRRPEGEPDYRITIAGTVVWIEAVSPAPGANPPRGWPDQPGSGRVTTPPFDWVLSRWTAAIREKQTKAVEYERRGVIKPGDAYVIAVDGGQLDRSALYLGASRLPFALEATLPVGPLAFRWEEGGRLLGTENTLRFSFKNHNGADIQTEPFLRQEFSNVSAVLGCWPPMFQKPELPVQIVHNPLARVSVALETFGKSAEEWRAVAVADGGEQFWQVERASMP